nr:hypothetical protein GCM10020092_004780 [Actinoplanes digitatis]
MAGYRPLGDQDGRDQAGLAHRHRDGREPDGLWAGAADQVYFGKRHRGLPPGGDLEDLSRYSA